MPKSASILKREDHSTYSLVGWKLDSQSAGLKTGKYAQSRKTIGITLLVTDPGNLEVSSGQHL